MWCCKALLLRWPTLVSGTRMLRLAMIAKPLTINRLHAEVEDMRWHW